MSQYLHDKYGAMLNGSRASVSVHFRLGGEAEVRPGLMRMFPFPKRAWYTRVMLEQFSPENVIYLLFSDDTRAMTKLINRIPASVKKTMQYHVVDEDFAHSMLLMSMCQHHIGTASTFSFWGSYLDKKQPGGGKTVFPPEYLEQHSHSEMPFREWLIVP